MIRFVAVALLAVLPCSLRAQEIQGETKVKRDRLVTLTVASVAKGASVAWEVIPVTPVTIAPNQPEGQFVFNAPPGQYVVKLTMIDWEARKFVQRQATVTIGEGDPTPPPGPTPPDPDKPQSELGKKFQTAYDKAKDAAALALFQAAMRAAVDTCRDGSFATNAELVAKINADTVAKVPAGKLEAMGVAVGEYLAANLPPAKIALDQDKRALYLNAYQAVYKALLEVRP